MSYLSVFMEIVRLRKEFPLSSDSEYTSGIHATLDRIEHFIKSEEAEKWKRLDGAREDEHGADTIKYGADMLKALQERGSDVD